MAKQLSSKQKKEELNKLFAQYNKRLGRLYSDYVKKLASLGYGEDVLEGDALFNFNNFPELKARLDDIFANYFQDNVFCYKQGMTDGVALAFSHDNGDLSGFSVLSDKAIRAVRDKAAATFISSRLKTEKGLNLSQRIWNYCQQTKSEFEMAMSNVIADGIKGGTSAEEIGRRIRQYLNDPDRMYRRYHTVKILKNGQKKDVVTWRRRRIINGKVRFVEEPLEKVGTGVYRSSRMNALRVARTEINAAYLRGHNARWANEPFVIGQWIHRSPQHKIEDICDELEGRYPKDFVFSSWHPQCLCTADPIMIEGEEKKEFYDRLYAGEDMSNYVSPHNIDNVPDNYKQYIENHEEAIVKAFEGEKLAWHLADNKKYWQQYLTPENQKIVGFTKELSREEKIKQAAEKRHAERNTEKIQKRWTLRRSANYMDKMNNAIYNLTYSNDKSLIGNALECRYNAVLATLKDSSTWSVANVEKAYQRFIKGVSIRERWDKLVWNGFSKEQIANCRKIEKIIGEKKGRPMSIEQADKQSANPNYYREEQYRINCATCSPTYVFREWGFRFTAKGNPEIKGNLNYWMSLQHSFDVWKNADGTPAVASTYKNWMRARGYKQMNANRYQQFITESCFEEGTYIITVGWKGGGGHATILKRLKNGEIVYIEPQHYNGSSAIRNISEICENASHSVISTRGILRVDDKIFDTQYLEIFNY